ncbi:MAG: glycosyltransferase family 4 protein [Rothia sp. (in: high G+C Gram-positive bacteria)]|nr:glycosyltransferase family 4 protein [Rothia sp. (in: high G+C Gram-positive bacteria)]
MGEQHIYIAANNGGIGGGEVMLLNLARAARQLGRKVTILAPAQPGELADAARDEGFSVITFKAGKRWQYMLQLRAWKKQNPHSLLWCNGLLPAVATGGLKNRVVHLHQLPRGKQASLTTFAQKRADLTLVPSQFLVDRVSNSRLFYNWVRGASPQLGKVTSQHRVRVGFLGRPSLMKGTDVLAEAIASLSDRTENKYQLVIGGEAKFVSPEEQQKLETKLSLLGGSLTTLGWVEPEDFYQKIDILVCPSRVPESFGLVVAEAMSTRMPLIISDAGALPEVVGEGYPWIVPAGDAQKLAETIETVARHLTGSSDYLEQVTTDVFWRWQEKFSPEAGKAALHAILKELEQRQ